MSRLTTAIMLVICLPLTVDAGIRLQSRPTSPPRGQKVPALRLMKPGEIRIRGQLRAIDCPESTRILIRIQVGTRLVSLLGRGLREIDFITYVRESNTTVECGVFTTPPTVLATYRAVARTKPTPVDGDVIAIEFIPPNFTPPPTGPPTDLSPASRRGR